MRAALPLILLLAGCQTAGLLPIEPVAAEQPADDLVCMPHQQMVAELGHRYGEVPVGIGVERRGVVVELYVGPDRTFSIVATNPEGVTCLIFAGDSWEQVVPVRDQGEGL